MDFNVDFKDFIASCVGRREILNYLFCRIYFLTVQKSFQFFFIWYICFYNLEYEVLLFSGVDC